MNPQNRIKVLLVVFALFWLALAVASLSLFRRDFQVLDLNLYDAAKHHVSENYSLSEIDKAFVSFYQSWARYVADPTQDRSLIDMRASEASVIENFDLLEKYFRGRMKLWIKVVGFEDPDPAKALSDLLKSRRVAVEKDGEGFQRVFYLTRDLFNRDVERSERWLKAYRSGNTPDPADMPGERDEDDSALLSLGVAEIRAVLADGFWGEVDEKVQQHKDSLAMIFWGGCAGLTVLSLLGALIVALILKTFRDHSGREEELVSLGARDPVTRLFNRRSLEVLLSQEIERARRRGYGVCVLMVKIEPYERMRQDVGGPAVDRLMVQIAEGLRASCRSYDGVFRYDPETFILHLPEVQPELIAPVIARFQKKFAKKGYIVKADKTKVTPIVKIGMAIYPEMGADYVSLIKTAQTNLAADFDPVATMAKVSGPLVGGSVVTLPPAHLPKSEIVTKSTPEPVVDLADDAPSLDDVSNDQIDNGDEVTSPQPEDFLKADQDFNELNEVAVADIVEDSNQIIDQPVLAADASSGEKESPNPSLDAPDVPDVVSALMQTEEEDLVDEEISDSTSSSADDSSSDAITVDLDQAPGADVAANFRKRIRSRKPRAKAPAKEEA